MGLYSVQMAHAAEIYVKVGDKISRGDKILKQGNTGDSFGEHLHLAVVRGVVPGGWTLDEAVPGGRYEPDYSQTMFFYGSDLYDPNANPDDTKGIQRGTYWWGGYKNHYAIDVIRGTGGLGPIVYWNRSMPGEVIGVYHHTAGKGKHVIIKYDGSYEPPKGKVGTVNMNKINLRDKPDLSAKVIGSANKGDRLVILDTVRDKHWMIWYKLDSGAYIKSDFVSF